MKAKFDKLKSSVPTPALWIAAAITAFYLVSLWANQPKISWKQTCGDFEFRIDSGEKVSVVNPFSHPVAVIVEDNNGVKRNFQKIPGGCTSAPMPMDTRWSCTVWGQGQPLGFVTFRRPKL